ncbi:MAG: uncharacterized protein JWM21_2229 [Acidobacteria bacterium]|nr:uncharacterized protein [Acidobacteriota bacterium]
MSSSLFDSLARGLSALFAPIARVVENPASLNRLLATLGVTPDADSRKLAIALGAVGQLKHEVEVLGAQTTPSLESIAAVLDASAKAFEALQHLEHAGGPLSELEGLGQDLVTLLIIAYLEGRAPALRHAAALLTLLEPAEEQQGHPPVIRDGKLLREPYRLERFRLDRLPKLLRDPVTTLRAEYGNPLATAHDAAAMADKLFPRLLRLLRALGVSCRYGYDSDHEAFLGDAAPLMAHSLIVYSEDPLNAAADEAGLVLSLSSAEQGDLGLVISPFGALSSQRPAGPWMIELDMTAGVDVLAWGRHGLTLLADLGTTEVAGRLSATLASPEEESAFIFGAANGSRLEVKGAQLKVETFLSEAQQSLELSADLSSAAIVIAPGDGDSFLRSVLPPDGLQAKFDLGLSWSSERGLIFRGAGSLDATLTVGLSLRGVLTVPTIYLGLRAGNSGVEAEVAASVGVSIGPIHAIIDRVGVAALVTFPEAGGNLGVADLDFRFKPPNGLGLTIDASVVVGGGFLRFDPQKGEYSGMLELQIAERISVKAIGLLTTRLPDGGKGYSLVVIIFVEDFTPIQLGFGFNLRGIGGLLAINRTFDEEVLRTGLKNHTLDSVMFPKDPIRNAPQILSNLNKVFPPAKDHHLFGPMLQIAWGSPPLITANLALVLELGARRRLLVLAQVVAILPKQENDLVRLQMDAIGVLDFDQGTASLDATLHDSRLLKKFVLTGDMAMRLKWESSPNFALAVGGLHPAFNPPPNFPKLERIAINLSSGDNPRLRCEAYFALTSNTVQFGARAELYASAHGFSIQGEIGFDVLIQFDPFAFLADFEAHLQLKRGSTNLFKIGVEGSLAGPRPLHIKGKATFSILWWDVTIRIDTTLVEGERPPLPKPIEVLPLLKAAVANPGNWTSTLPAGHRAMVTLRAKPAAGTDVLLHPLGTLTFKEGVVPLNFDISRFGQAAPADGSRFTITVSLGADKLESKPVRDFFAPAQFIEMSDDEKLSRPSFEQMDAGITFGSDLFTITDKADDWLEVPALEFETFIVDTETNVSRRSQPAGPQKFYLLSHELLLKQARFGAAANSELRRTGKAKYRTTTDKYRVAKEGWSIVAIEDLTVQPVSGVRAGRPASYSEAAQSLRKTKQEDSAKAAGLKILRLSELSEG